MPLVYLSYVVDFLIACCFFAGGIFFIRYFIKAVAYPFKKRPHVNKPPLNKMREQSHWKMSIKTDVLHKVADALPRRKAVTQSEPVQDVSASDSVTPTDSTDLKAWPVCSLVDYSQYNQPTFQRKNVVIH